jgi:hypothetical protein
MNSVIIINKNGEMSSLSVKKLAVDTLYKRAGFKQPADFELKFSWNQPVRGEVCAIQVFGKTVGREPQKNVFCFDNSIVFFGNILLVGMRENSVVNIKCDDIDCSMIPGFRKDALVKNECIPAVPPPDSLIPHIKRDVKDRLNNLRTKVVSEPKNYFDCSSELIEVAYI